MSLHTLAHHLQEAGRGEDKVLVHMTPKEVGGLQALAMAHGGSLTTNPQTGLPEAGFLSSLLPMLAGGALTALSGGALSPLMAAGMVGGGTALATGSLRKGLMAGLGAYGGAGLGAGLTSMGTTAGTAAAAPSTGIEAMKASMPGTGTGIFANPTLPSATATPTSPLFATNQAVLQSPTMSGQLGYGGFNASQFMGASPTAAAIPAIPAAPVVPPLQTSTPIYGASEIATSAPQSAFNKLTTGIKAATGNGVQGLKDLYAASEAAAPYSGYASLGALALAPRDPMDVKKDKSLIRPYDYSQNPTDIASQPYSGSAERLYFNPTFTARTPYEAPGPEYAAGGPVETMSAANAVGSNMAYPQANIQTPLYSNPIVQRPMPTNVVSQGIDAPVDTYTGEPRLAGGGLSSLGSYSDGGRLLRGPGDGVSDSIPAVIGERQPARLADGEFVIPARVVSELGNGSTEAGARKLYAMMDRVQKARSRTTGKDKIAVNTRAEKHLPA